MRGEECEVKVTLRHKGKKMPTPLSCVGMSCPFTKASWELGSLQWSFPYIREEYPVRLLVRMLIRTSIEDVYASVGAPEDLPRTG